MKSTKLMRCDATRALLVLTPIAKPMNRFAVCDDPRADKGPSIAKMTKHEMIGWFKSAPTGSRHQRMLWAARKIGRTAGGMVKIEGGWSKLSDEALVREHEPIESARAGSRH
jgi:hypothetical protein